MAKQITKTRTRNLKPNKKYGRGTETISKTVRRGKDFTTDSAKLEYERIKANAAKHAMYATQGGSVAREITDIAEQATTPLVGAGLTETFPGRNDPEDDDLDPGNGSKPTYGVD